VTADQLADAKARLEAAIKYDQRDVISNELAEDMRLALAEIERLRSVVASLMAEADPYPDLGESVESLMRKVVPTDAPRSRGMGSRKMNWPRVERENKMAKNPLPKMTQTFDDGRAELPPMERLDVID
jgi:hypothetical protein